MPRFTCLFLVSGFSGGKFVNIAPAPVLGKPSIKQGHIQMAGQGIQQIAHMQDSSGRMRQVVKLVQVYFTYRVPSKKFLNHKLGKYS